MFQKNHVNKTAEIRKIVDSIYHQFWNKKAQIQRCIHHPQRDKSKLIKGENFQVIGQKRSREKDSEM